MVQSTPDSSTPGQASLTVPVRRHSDAPRPAPAAYGPEDFPGCESFHLPGSEIRLYEGRLEFWDARTETAWKVCEPTSIQHEEPSRRLVEMATRVASLRGSRIVCFGSSDLVRHDAAGRKRWLMQADEVLYLHPDRSRLQGPAIDVDEDPLSEEAWRALERVALAMGAREGTGPEDDPLMRSVSRMVQARGHAEGHKEGHADGRVRGRIEAVTATLHARGIEVSGDLAQDHGLFAEHPIEPLMAAALACTGEADFRRRLREETG